MTQQLAPAPAGTTPGGTAGTVSFKDLAGATRSDRNRAVDFYRAVAMVAVAIGHWLATAVGMGADGLFAGNALEYDPSMSWITWFFQVMPLFFVVGGFSSAMSLDSFTAREPDARPQDWVANRLRRMVAPTVPLALLWAGLLLGGHLLGHGALIGVGAVAASIPLWFLANYTIDTAIAPYVRPIFKANPAGVALVGVTAFCVIEALRFAGVPFIPHLNWVLGWLLFQIAGFAWKDGLLPTGRRMLAVAAGLWPLAIAAVTVGPWPTAMVHFPGLENSPTHPPSLALLLFGAAYSATAIAFAPTISDWLAGNRTAWSAVVGANGIAMSVYLWHFTAIIAAVALFLPFGWLPTAAVGTGAWWLQKLPLILAATAILAVIVKFAAPVEQKALFAERTPWKGGPLSMLVTAFGLSMALKQWAHGDLAQLSISVAIVLAVWFGRLRSR